MAELNEYTVLISGVEHTMLLSADDAKQYGASIVEQLSEAELEAQAAAIAAAAEAAKKEAEESETKQVKPANKAATAENK